MTYSQHFPIYFALTDCAPIVTCFKSVPCLSFLTCEQALWSALAAGREKEGELATTSLEFKYLHRKSQCEMLIGRDDRFLFALIGRNLTARSTGSHRGSGVGIPFLAPPPERPGELARRLPISLVWVTE